MTKTGENRFLLVYGSQTGQAQAICEEIAEKATKYGLVADLHGLDKTEKKFWLERERCVVIVTSTTGDGEAPDNAQKFWRRLKKKTLPSDHLKDLNFALLGLGDSNYTNFCNCGKTFNKRLLELGAKHFYPPGWADDATGLEVVVEPWMESLYSAVQHHLGIVAGDETDCVDNSASASGLCNGHAEPPLVECSDGESVELPSCSLASEEISTQAFPESCVLSSNITNDTVPTQPGSEDKILTDGILISKSSEMWSVPNVLDGTSGVSVPSATATSSQTIECLDCRKLTTHIVDVGHINTSNYCDNDTDIVAPGQAGDVSENAAQMTCLTWSWPPLCDGGLTVPSLPPSYLRITFKPKDSVDLNSIPLQNGCPLPSANSDVSMVPVVKVSQLTSDDAVKKALKFEVDISSCSWTYQPGDAVGIVCPNPEDDVEKLVCRLGLKAEVDTVYELEIMDGTKKRNAYIPKHLPEKGTLGHTLTNCMDIHSVPKKALIRALVEFTSVPSQKARLQELCSKEGAEHYSKYIRENGVSLIDLLNAFPSCQPPITVIMEHLPRLQPRPYSASSSLHAHPGKVHFVFNVVEIPDRGQHQQSRKGICTGWLDRLTLAQQHRPSEDIADSLDKLVHSEVLLPVFLRSNASFRPPDDLSKPIIMIGPGTGVAPFIGFLQDRQAKIATVGIENEIGETWLFYGCRQHDKDFLFRQELEDFVTNGTLKHLHVSFSRDIQPEGAPKYVQDNLMRNSMDLLRLIDQEEARIYVCGDARGMARGVMNTLTEIMQLKGISKKEASDYLMQMRIYKRYLEDVWT